MGAPSSMVSFYPDIPEVETSMNCGEFVFLMDCSYSMQYDLSCQGIAQVGIEAAKVKPASFLFMSHILLCI
jgi:hypothetical protein